MASKMLFQVSRALSKRWFSASSVAAPLSEPLPYIPETPAATTPGVTAIGPVQVTRLPNGVTVASREDASPYSNISVFIRSGSRSESYEQRGTTHLLANSAFLSTVDKSALALNRQLDHIGTSFNATNTREFVLFNAISPRGTQDAVVEAFGSLISFPALYPWEIKDEWPRLAVDRMKASSNPTTVIMEDLHKYAFRSGLSNSLYCPDFNDTKFDSEVLRDFISAWYIGQNTTVAGVGVDHDELVKLVGKSFSSLPDLLPRQITKAEYVGGGESRVDANTSSVHAAIVCRGASLTGDHKDLVASRILQHVLGERQFIKWGSGSVASRLNKAVASTVDSPFEISAINLNYSDNGLFGMYAVSHGNIIKQVLKSAMVEFAEVAKGNVSTEDLSRAKNQLKLNILASSESRSCDITKIGQQVAFTGAHTPVDEAVIDSVTQQDVNKFAKMVFATRPTLVVYGNLCNTPRLDELLSGISVK